ncbi:MAG: Tat pathway signal protein [Kiritimatiellae bacterium]|jgi:hypothetical protein|nr:Tat pathway signal protein [Kiritimatiellia bacterium]
MKEVSRRTFVQSGLTATAVSAFPGAGHAQAASPEFMWGALLHMGVNMWSDIPVDSWGHLKPEKLKLVCQADHLRFDEKVWQTLTARMQKAGMNLIVIDLGEALQYESHPELSVKGSWKISRFRNELARLRAMGLEPIPKLNFSTAHDTWLKTYGRQVSTPVYYSVCADMIKEVCAIFDTPRFFHLGYDEETAAHQRKYSYAVVRQGELWWHDFLFFVKQVEKQGVRPWIWSDYCWNHPDEFMKRMPKSVLQSNWYYGEGFDPAKQKHVKAYIDLEKAGFDQVPTGSNWSNDVNFKGTVDFCKKNIAPERLKGFLMASWFFTLPGRQEKNLQAIAQVEKMIKG